jgi:cobalt/nickel transport system permease protein
VSATHPLRTYTHLDSAVHRAPALAKLLGTFGIVLGIACIPTSHAVWALAPLTLVVAVALASCIPASALLLRLVLVLPFVLSLGLLALFQHEGLRVFSAVVLKSTACVAALQLLTQTTPVHDLLRALRRLGVPATLLDTVGMLHRYLHVLADESLRMRRARAARTWRTERWVAWRNLSSVIAVSFIRSVARAERIAAGMRARAWS